MEEKETPITDYIEQRSTGSPKGRREADKHKCGMCDFIMDKNDNCFEIIKRTMRDEAKKTTHQFELFDSKLQAYMTKWSTGIIISICSGVLGAGMIFGMWQLNNVHRELMRNHDGLAKISVSLAALKISVAEQGVKQEGVLSRLKEIAPEHKNLMNHLRDAE